MATAADSKDKATDSHADEARRIISTAVLKIDHFQAIYRLKKEFDGAPNYRQVADFPIFGTGQPSLAGFEAVLGHTAKQGIKRWLWICMRQEPIVYAGNMSMAPREPSNLNENVELHGVDGALIDELQDILVKKTRKLALEAGNAVDYYQDTFAENPADRINHQYKQQVDDPNTDVRSLSGAYEYLRTEKKFDVTLVKVPIADERAPSAVDFDTLVNCLKGVVTEKERGIFFNCQMGKGRTTTGMVVAMLIKRAMAPNDTPALKVSAPTANVYDQDQTGDVDKGEFAVIVSLVRLLNSLGFDGAKAKAHVDDACDRAHHMQNLRDCIMYTKKKFDEETVERRVFWKRMSINFIERYFYLIAFTAYLNAAAPEFKSSFVEWKAEHPKIPELLGTRQKGHLAEFNWT